MGVGCPCPPYTLGSTSLPAAHDPRSQLLSEVRLLSCCEAEVAPWVPRPCHGTGRLSKGSQSFGTVVEAMSGGGSAGGYWKH